MFSATSASLYKVTGKGFNCADVSVQCWQVPLLKCAYFTVDGSWSSWTTWSGCSVTCSDGHMTRNRTCTNPLPSHGGHNCVGNTTDTMTCHFREPCPGESVYNLSIISPVDTVFHFLKCWIVHQILYIVSKVLNCTLGPLYYRSLIEKWLC